MDTTKLQRISEENTTENKTFRRDHDNFDYSTFSSLTNVQGVYTIYNNETKKQYIGSSTDIGRRLQKHFSELRFNRHTNKKLQEDFNKYGIESFGWNVIVKTSTELIDIERECQISVGIDNLYNEKISNYYISEDLKKKYASSNKASHKTKEYREKMSLLKSHAIVQYDKDGNPIKVYDNINDILKENPKFKGQTIRGACNGSKYQAYGFFWRYLNKDGSVKEIEK